MILCSIAYWATVTERVAMNVTGLLAIAAVYIAVIGTIPTVGYMTRLDYFMNVMFCLIFVNTVFHMLVVRLNAEEKGTNWPLRKLAVRWVEFLGRATMLPAVLLTYIICFSPVMPVFVFVITALALGVFEYVMCKRYLPALKSTFVATLRLLEEKRAGSDGNLSSIELRFVKRFAASRLSGGSAAQAAKEMEGIELQLHTGVVKSPLGGERDGPAVCEEA
jgi:hypothetical protein